MSRSMARETSGSPAEAEKWLPKRREDEIAYLAALHVGIEARLRQAGVIGWLWGRNHRRPETEIEWQYVVAEYPVIASEGLPGRGLLIRGRQADDQGPTHLFDVGYQIGARVVSSRSELPLMAAQLVAYELTGLRSDSGLPHLDTGSYAIIPEGGNPTYLKPVAVPIAI